MGTVHLAYVDHNTAPAKLWRAVNPDSHGLQARGNVAGQGWGIPIKTANYQLCPEIHFDWKHPDLSPVLSWTASKGFARNLCHHLLDSGRWQAIEIDLVEIDC